MSGIHAHTAAAQADLARADAQDRKPHIPPGHVEDERPVAPTQRPMGHYFGGGILAIAAVVALVFILA